METSVHRIFVSANQRPWVRRCASARRLVTLTLVFHEEKAAKLIIKKEPNLLVIAKRKLSLVSA